MLFYRPNLFYAAMSSTLADAQESGVASDLACAD